MTRKLLIALLFVLVLYMGSYVWFRASHAHVWAKDGKTYVIFPVEQRLIWFVYRPLTYLDASLTGMRFHIGPHR